NRTSMVPTRSAWTATWIPKARSGPLVLHCCMHFRMYASVPARVLGPPLSHRTSWSSSPARCASRSSRHSGERVTTPSESRDSPICQHVVVENPHKQPDIARLHREDLNAGMREAFPLVDQWSLLAARGFATRFSGLWVKNDDPEEVARLLRADPESRLDARPRHQWELFRRTCAQQGRAQRLPGGVRSPRRWDPRPGSFPRRRVRRGDGPRG